MTGCCLLYHQATITPARGNCYYLGSIYLPDLQWRGGNKRGPFFLEGRGWSLTYWHWRLLKIQISGLLEGVSIKSHSSSSAESGTKVTIFEVPSDHFSLQNSSSRTIKPFLSLLFRGESAAENVRDNLGQDKNPFPVPLDFLFTSVTNCSPGGSGQAPGCESWNS